MPGKKIERRQGSPVCSWTHNMALSPFTRTLSVGISVNLAERLANHKRKKQWWPEVTSIALEHAGKYREALSAEIDCIRSIKPKYNKRSAV
jgi:hypothetical protein